jgi:hypothetical protein
MDDQKFDEIGENDLMDAENTRQTLLDQIGSFD